jgi:hypothetical protein
MLNPVETLLCGGGYDISITNKRGGGVGALRNCIFVFRQPLEKFSFDGLR